MPCLRCNKCHVPGPEQLEHRLLRQPGVGPGAQGRAVWSPRRPTAQEDRRGRRRPRRHGGRAAGRPSRGHAVTLYEKRCSAGRPASTPPRASTSSGPWSNSGTTWSRQIAQVRRGCPAGHAPRTPTLLRTEGYDEVVVAIGSEPLLSPHSQASTGTNVIPADRQWYARELEHVPRRGDRGRRRNRCGDGAPPGPSTAMGSPCWRWAPFSPPRVCPVHFRSLFERAWETQEGFTVPPQRPGHRHRTPTA